MTRQDIEAAIANTQIHLDYISTKEFRKISDCTEAGCGKAIRGLIQVAKAWLKLEELGKEESPFLLTKMDEFLNPKPKSDLERIRDWVAGQLFGEAEPDQTIKQFQDLLRFISELEAEKEKP